MDRCRLRTRCHTRTAPLRRPDRSTSALTALTTVVRSTQCQERFDVSRERMPAENDVVEFLPLDEVYYVQDVRLERDIRSEQVRSIRCACQCWCEHIMTATLKLASY